MLFRSIIDEERALSARLTEANKRIKVSSGLGEADAARDEASAALFSLVNAYAVFPLAETREKGLLVKAVTDNYTGITKQKYAVQSAWTESLLKDLAAESLADAIAALPGLTQQIAALAAAEADFKEKNAGAVDVKAESSSSATDIRKELLACINDKLIPYLNVVALVDEATYGDFAQKIAIEADRANASIARRAKSSSTATADSATGESA